MTTCVQDNSDILESKFLSILWKWNIVIKISIEYINAVSRMMNAHYVRDWLGAEQATRQYL